ncbi:MAG: flavodoxin family protein [Negativicutes bacterium]
MKIVVLQGSPRVNGNTAQLAKEVIKPLEAKNAEIKWYNLNQLNIRGCQSCYVCKKQAECVIKDDAKEILENIAAADAVIFATPVFMWDMTGQLKLMVDRLFAFMNLDFSSKLIPGKKFLWVVTQGQPDVNIFRPNFEKSVKVLQMMGFGEGKIFIAGGFMELADVSKQEPVVAEARQMAAWLAS